MNTPRELQNRLNKEEALTKLAAEDFSRKTISFYRYVKIDDPIMLRNELFAKWDDWGCLGRIYVAKEGINAQMSVPEPCWDDFMVDLYSYELFKDVPFKHAVEDEHSFWKLTIKVKDKIVADGLDDASFDASDVGRHLNAVEFNELLDNPESVCVDMRNFYESEVGHFEGAICPDVATFREELPETKQLLKGKEEKPVLLYCTGGIRCEKASAYLRHHGFKNVNQLHGGIIDYAHQVKAQGLESKFKGKNFVFDERLAESITDDVLTNCHLCGASCDAHTNCANKACNLLFIECATCKEKLTNCCSETCQGIANLPEGEQRVAWKNFQKSDTLSLSKSPFRPNVSVKN